MGERGVITTRKDIDENGIGVYLHWLGAPEDVYPLLEYCRIRGFRCPEDDSFGYAGLIQVAANASDGDGLSVDVNRLDHLDTNNWNNGTYVIEGWKVVERLYCSDEEPEIDDFYENLRDFDRAQPYDQRIGDVMLRALWERDLTIPEAASSFYTITGCNEFQRRNVEGFHEGSWYAVETRGLPMMRVVRLEDDSMTVSIDGKEVEAIRFFWKDGTESAYAKLEDGSALVSYSTKMVQEPSIDSDKLDK